MVKLKEDWKNIAWILKKELREILRNRRALLEMILVPFLMTPVLTLFVPFVITSISTHYFQEQIVDTVPLGKQKVRKKGKQRIAITGRQWGQGLVSFLEKKTTLKVVKVKDARAEIRHRKVEIVIEIEKHFESNLLSGKKAKLHVIAMPINIKGIIAYLKVKAALENYFVGLKEKERHKKERGLHYKVEVGTLAKKKEIGGFVLGLITPTFFLFWMMMGGNSIAIDITAGEKERKTLEGLLSLPLQRWHILGGKFLTATLAALFSVGLATLGMALPMAIFFHRLPGSWRPYLAAYVPTFWQGIGLLSVLTSLALILASLQMLLGIVSRSMKEAEYFLYPLVLPIVMPAALALFLELQDLKAPFFLVPILGNALMIREAVSLPFHPLHFLLSLWASLCTVAFLLYLAWESLSQDTVLFTLG